MRSFSALNEMNGSGSGMSYLAMTSFSFSSSTFDILPFAWGVEAIELSTRHDNDCRDFSSKALLFKDPNKTDEENR
jgi:hypothetical protein